VERRLGRHPPGSLPVQLGRLSHRLPVPSPGRWRPTAIRLEDLPPQLCEEIVHFFSIYKQPEGEHVEVDVWYPRDDAVRVIREARERFELAQTTSS
jgi:Inorganic pyrophosphatase